MCDFQPLFQEDFGFIDVAEIVDQQLGLLHRMEFCHSLQDPVAIYMESVFTKASSVVAFSMQTKYGGEYKLYIIFLLQTSQFFCILSFNCKEDHFLRKMITWMHWKFTYTWSIWFTHVSRVGWLNKLAFEQFVFSLLVCCRPIIKTP